MMKHGEDAGPVERFLALVRERQEWPDGSGDWLPVALYDFSEFLRADERTRIANDNAVLASAVADAVLVRLGEAGGLKGPSIDAPGSALNLVTVRQFAGAMKVSPSTVYEWLKRGLPSQKLGGLRRILKSEAIQFLMDGGLRRSRAARRFVRRERARQ